MAITFDALVKQVNRKALVSGDLSVQIILQSVSPESAEKMKEANACPADQEVRITIEPCSV